MKHFTVLENNQNMRLHKKLTLNPKKSLALGVSDTGGNFHLYPARVCLSSEAQTFVLFQILLQPWPLHAFKYLTTIFLEVFYIHLGI